MKKFGRYIIYLAVLGQFVIAMSFIIHIAIDKTPVAWLFYTVALDFLYYIPIITSLSILWPLVIRTRKEAESGVTPAATGFFIIVYIFGVMAGCVAFQEIAVPGLYEIAKNSAGTKSVFRMAKSTTDRTGKKFSVSEFYNLNGLPAKSNIAFAMGNSFLYFQKMYKKGGSYYVTGFRMVGYKEGGKALDQVLASAYAKIVDDEIFLVNPVVQKFSGGKMVSSGRVGIRSVPLIYDATGIFNLGTDSSSKASSLIDIFRSNNYVLASKINFFHVGNMVFNKIAYYISVILILILVSSFGSAFRSQRPLYRDYFQTICFYAVSFVGVAVIYDILISIVNTVYGLVI